jgi:hypothetical protein
LKRRDFVSNGIFSYSTGIFLGKYPGNGGKAENKRRIGKKIPLSSTNQKTAF